MRELFPAASEDALDLIGRLLQLNPARRISAAEALEHRYFQLKPDPTPPPLLPRLDKKEKEKEKEKEQAKKMGHAPTPAPTPIKP